MSRIKRRPSAADRDKEGWESESGSVINEPGNKDAVGRAVRLAHDFGVRNNQVSSAPMFRQAPLVRTMRRNS